MKLANTVFIPAAPDEVFALVNDVERVATCVPGVALTGRDGDFYLGGIKVKVGPIGAAYSGKLRFGEVDPAARRLTLSGSGADAHGGGNAQAQIELTVVERDGGSELRVDSDVVLSGKIVAFGKGAIVAVSNKLMAQFATNLANQLTGAGSPGAAPQPVNGMRPMAAVPVPVSSADDGFDVMSLIPASARQSLSYAGVFVLGMFEGWLIARAFRRTP